jgi:serine/threonine-protein kinase
LDRTYEIVRLVGAGGVGEVYEAAHARLAGRYAVKVLLGEVSKRDEVLRRFQREAEVTSALRHPNIVQVVDFNRLPDGTPYLVMEFLDGVELAVEIQRHGPMTVARVMDLVGQLASGLAAAHSQKIIHRDLKPQNLFLVHLPGDEREIVKILDFGISKVREAATKLTRQASIIGTPQYMAPEQARGQIDEIDERTDLFSLAAITYEMFAGRPPFCGEAVEAILYQVVHEAPLPFPQPMPAIEAVVLRGMAKNKLERHSGVREFHQALVNAAHRTTPLALTTVALFVPESHGAATHAESSSPTAILPGTTTLSRAVSAPSTGTTIETHRRRWPLAAASLLLAAGLASVLLWRTGTAPPPNQLPPILQVVAVSPPDSGSPVVRPVDAAIDSQLSAPEPAVGKPKPPLPSKKRVRLRMEDL